jgi:hypothetical protein
VQPAVLENGIEEAAHILDHECAGADFIDEAQGFWKQIPLVFDAELLSRDRERRTGQTTRQQINPLIGPPIEGRQITFAYIPAGAVQP